jgi:hypothetical protein
MRSTTRLLGMLLTLLLINPLSVPANASYGEDGTCVSIVTLAIRSPAGQRVWA